MVWVGELEKFKQLYGLIQACMGAVEYAWIVWVGELEKFKQLYGMITYVVYWKCIECGAKLGICF
jgi:hypothetical protein